MAKCAIYIKLESILGDILTINIEITYVYIVASGYLVRMLSLSKQFIKTIFIILDFYLEIMILNMMLLSNLFQIKTLISLY